MCFKICGKYQICLICSTLYRFKVWNYKNFHHILCYFFVNTNCPKSADCLWLSPTSIDSSRDQTANCGKNLGKSCPMYSCLKGIVHLKMKITPLYTHPQAMLGLYDFLLSDKYYCSCIKKVLALPIFIMAVNGGWDFEAQKSASINHKKCSTRLWGLIKAFWSELMYLCKKNINI